MSMWYKVTNTTCSACCDVKELKPYPALIQSYITAGWTNFVCHFVAYWPWQLSVSSTKCVNRKTWMMSKWRNLFNNSFKKNIYPTLICGYMNVTNQFHYSFLICRYINLKLILNVLLYFILLNNFFYKHKTGIQLFLKRSTNL